MALIDTVALAPVNGEWHNYYYEDFVAAINAYLSTITGANLADPFTLSRDGQSLINDGSDMNRVACVMGNIAHVATVDQWHHGVVVATGFKSAAGVYLQGDGTTDDTSALQRCIDLTILSGQDPCIVLIPPGTYLIDTLTIATSNLVLQGCGPATVLKARSSARPVISVGGCSYCEIRDLTIDGNMTGSKTNIVGINIDDADHLLIDNCTLKKIKGIGIKGSNYGAGNKRGTKITNCRFKEIARGTTYTQNSAIFFADDCSWTNGEISGCYFEGYYGSTTSTTGIYLQSGRNISIHANIFNDNMRAIVLERSANAEVMDQITISGNVISGADLPINGIYLHSVDGGGTAGILESVAMVGNIINIPCLTDYSSGIEIKTEDAATVTLTQHVSISGNVIGLDDATTHRYGIYFNSRTANDCSAANYGSIFGNVVSEPYVGIYLMEPSAGAPAGDKTSSFAIGGNMVRNDTTAGVLGIGLGSTVTLEVEKMTVVGNVTAGQTIGIQGSPVVNIVAHNIEA
jgi:hypothetical protein